VVELVLGEVKATDQRPDSPVARIHGDEGALNFRQLGDLPSVLGCANNPDHRAGTDA
jgi:hypothetical protein